MTQKFNNFLRNEEFEKAYELLKKSITSKPVKPEILALSKKLSAVLRSKAKDFAVKKADREAVALEKILKKVIAINGEGFYS